MNIYAIGEKIFLFTCFIINTGLLFAQNDTIKLSVNELLKMASDNNREIKLSAEYLTRAGLEIRDRKNDKLPDIGFSGSAGYLTDVGVVGLGTMPDGFYEMPHFANSYALQASLLLYAGGRINTTIDIAELQYRLAELNLRKRTQSVKLVLIGYYLDLYQLYQQKIVYEKNIFLSKELLNKINDRYSAGMALKSDRIRNELLVSTFDLALTNIKDQILITNNNIISVLDLPQGSTILPDDLLDIPVEFENLIFRTTDKKLQDSALGENPESKEANVNIDIANKKLERQRSFNYPQVSLFFSGTFNRPYAFDIPAKDIYANNNSVGVKVNIPVGNLYLSKRKVEIAEKDISIAHLSKEIVEQNLIRNVSNNFIKCRQAYNQLQTIEKQQELANENYRRITDNYMEQLALNTEVMDASNQKLEADLRMTTAKVRIVYAYYQLLKILGQL
ncbi:TolC family protein [Sinomicrobium sp. M5D2P17]